MKPKTKGAPPLRFPGFIEDWREVTLGQISVKVGSGSTPRGGERAYQPSGIPFIRSQNVNDNELKLEEVAFISSEVNQQMKGSVVQANDILLNITGASIGRSCVVPDSFESGNVNQHVCIIRLNAESSPKFLQPLLSSSRGQKLIFEGQTGSGREGLNFQSIKSFKIVIPNITEQQKIAAFLALVDEKVRQLARKKNLLLKYKEGVMQHLFNQKFRFKDDNDKDFPEWETKRLGDICQINPSSAGLPELFVYIDLDSVESGKLNKETVLRRDKAPSRAQRVLNKGDILFQMVRPYQRNNLIFDRDGSFVASTGYAQIRPLIDTNFLFQSVLTYSFVKSVVRRCTGTSYPAISAEDLAEIRIAIPSHKEQEKIGEFLHYLDKKIDFVDQEIELIRTFKKGLLQQMFL